MAKIEPTAIASTTETPAPKRDAIDVAKELFPDCEDFRCNSAGDVTCRNDRKQTVLIPASKIAQYQ